MTEYLYTYKRPRRMKCHQAMVRLDRGLKDGYRSGRLVEPIKGRKRRPKARAIEDGYGYDNGKSVY